MPKHDNYGSYANDGFHKNDSIPSKTYQNSSFKTSAPTSHQLLQTPTINIHRQAFNQADFDIYAEYDKPKPPLKLRLKAKIRNKLECSSQCLLNKLLGFFPFITIFKTYKLPDFFNDIISGLTVGILNIPQGMAYGMLANLPPIYGLYTSFFPVIIYFFFATSRHISMGTFALISLMVGEVIKNSGCGELAHEVIISNSSNDTSTPSPAPSDDKVLRCELEYATATTFFAGLFQIIFAILKADVLTEYLSGPITRALTTGAALHIFTSQLRHVFGYSLGHSSGFLTLIKKFIRFFGSLPKTNLASLVTAVICLILLYLNKRFVSPKVVKYIKMPFPIELILLVVLTGLSYGFNFASPTVFNMTIVGPIPRGFPPPAVPNLSLLSVIFKDAIVIAIVAFVISFSMAKLFSDMDKYKIDSNQELYAYGIASIVSSFFSCFMPSASLSRSNVQYNSGCKTQLTGLVSCLLLLVVILALGPLFYTLPNCVLAAIIIFNLKSTFLQITDLNYLFRISLLDAITWVVTCAMVILSNVDFGLIVGVAFSIYSIVLRTQRPKVQTIGNIGGTERYEEVKYFAKSKETEKIKVVRMAGSLYYANKSHFSDKIDYSQVLGKEDLQKVSTMFMRKKPIDVNVIGESADIATRDVLETTDLILDCSMVVFIDSDGLEAVNKAINDYKHIGVKLHLASCNEKVKECVLKACELGKFQSVEMYLTVHDAVTLIKADLVTQF